MLTRGSKTAAEKVVRESESGPDLGSPDKRESIPPVTDMQVCIQFGLIDQCGVIETICS